MQLIRITFDSEMPGYVITMPDFITLESLTQWKMSFDGVMTEISEDSEYVLLIDTGNHNFESAECLRFLRDYLSITPAFREKFKKAAFVAPSNFVAPHIESNMEAYFNEFDAAYDWIKAAPADSK